MEFIKKKALVILLTMFICGVPAFAASAPAWVQQAMKTTVPTYEKDVPSVILYRDETVTFDSSGKIVTTERQALRVLNKEGIREAAAHAFYLAKFSQIKDFQAWLIAPGGAVKEFGKKETIDRISDPDDVYDEGRVKIISAASEADIGYVFAYSYTTEDKPLFYQLQYLFQESRPTLRSVFSLTLPQGWNVSSLTFNRAEVSPTVSGNTHVWELRDLPPIPYEPLSPSFANLVPRIAVNFAPADKNMAVNKAFTDWLEVSNWATQLYDPQVVINDEIAGKARELTAGKTTELEKIAAIGTFVQNLQYISIDIGVGYGNGMKPRASDLVMNRGYGDCKDKANLMRAMLRALKIESFPIIIYSGDPTFVRKEWASPRQFNHCIIAVAVSDGTEAATVVKHPSLGRLLIFDATDPYTPVGDLPDYLQGSNALVVAGDKGGIFEMPVTPPEFNAWNRHTNVVLGPDGSITGKIMERVSGQESRAPRTMFRSVSRDDFRKSIERWLTRGATAARLQKLEPVDKHASAQFELDIEFFAPSYGQLMQNRLLVFKPAVASRTRGMYLTEKARKHRIEFESNSFTENVVFELPAGFDVDEMPDAVNLAMPFGTYDTKYEVKDGKLFYTRSLITKRTSVPAEKYSAVREFYTKIMDAEQTPVVLVRK